MGEGEEAEDHRRLLLCSFWTTLVIPIVSKLKSE